MTPPAPKTPPETLRHKVLHLLGSDDDVLYRAISSLPFSAGVTVVGAVLIGLLVLLFQYVIPLPSEISTWELVKVLAIVVCFAWVFIWYVLLKVRAPGHRLAITGIGLLSVGTVLAFVTLPSHEATSALSGGIAVLPPAPGPPGQGFEVGLSTRLDGCNQGVRVKLVIDGTPTYWNDFPRHVKPVQTFVLVLPGRYGRIVGGLGRTTATDPLADPEHVERITDRYVKEDLHLTAYERGTGSRDLTVLVGKVREWPRFRRPVVIETTADWISRRDFNDCNLQVPALVGSASSASLFEAEPCGYLDRHYLSTACTDPPGEAGDALAPGLQVSRAVSMVSGAPLAEAASQPADVEIDGAHGWRCESPAGAARASGAPTTGASALASLAEQGNCHAVATVESSSWHRDFLIVLIGALIGVGIHMLFQSMVDPAEASRKKAEHAAEEA